MYEGINPATNAKQFLFTFSGLFRLKNGLGSTRGLPLSKRVAVLMVKQLRTPAVACSILTYSFSAAALTIVADKNFTVFRKIVRTTKYRTC